MRKLDRDPGKLESLEVFRRLDRPSRTSLNDQVRVDDVIAHVRSSLNSALATRSTVHGWRAQGMFESLIVALDGCELLMIVDHGQVFFDGEPVKPPDFLVVLRDGRRLLVDVKSLSPNKVRGNVSLSGSEFAGLNRFGQLLNAEVYVAYLMPSAFLWSLVPLDGFEILGNKRSMALAKLIASSEMRLLGDIWLGIEAPIRMELIADRAKPRPVRTEHTDVAEVQFTVGAVEFYVGQRRLTGKGERDLAYFMLMFGQWDVEDQVVVHKDDLDRIIFEAAPPEQHAGQSFEIVGNLSRMYAKWFDLATRAGDGTVLALDAATEPGMLPALVPQGWQSDELPVWRLDVSPPDSQSQQSASCSDLDR